MATTLVIVTAKWCSACNTFKQRHRDRMVDFFEGKGVIVREHSSSETSNNLVASVTFYPCFFLIDTISYEISANANANAILPRITIMGGEVIGGNGTYRMVPGAQELVSSFFSVDSYARFLASHSSQTEHERPRAKATFHCKPINPVNRSYK